MTIEIAPDDVRPIFDTQLDDTQLTAFCEMAALVVNEDLGESGLSAARLKKIGINLAAHFASMRQRQVNSERVEGDLTLSYQGKTGEGFASSFYGQTAVNLDSSGILSRLTENLKKPSLWVLGYPPE